MHNSFKNIALKISSLVILLLLFADAQAVTRTSTGNGSWDDPTTWSPSGLPGNGDVLTIEVGHTVAVDHTGALYGSPAPDLTVYVYGVLSFPITSTKLNLGGNSVVNIMTGGLLSTDAASPSQHLIVGTKVWDGSDGNVSGPWQFTSSGGLVLLPVTLLSFEASVMADEIMLRWITADEKSFSHFEVERSLDGLQFEYVGREESKGDATGTSQYRFFDSNVQGKIVYYRLKMVDLDGSHEYSEAVVVNNGGSSILSIFPNPAPSGHFRIMQGDATGSEALVKVFDMSGQEICATSIQLAAGPVDFEPAVALRKGAYIVTVMVKNQVFKEKLIVQ